MPNYTLKKNVKNVSLQSSNIASNIVTKNLTVSNEHAVYQNERLKGYSNFTSLDYLFFFFIFMIALTFFKKNIKHNKKRYIYTDSYLPVRGSVYVSRIIEPLNGVNGVYATKESKEHPIAIIRQRNSQTSLSSNEKSPKKFECLESLLENGQILKNPTEYFELDSIHINK